MIEWHLVPCVMGRAPPSRSLPRIHGQWLQQHLGNLGPPPYPRTVHSVSCQSSSQRYLLWGVVISVKYSINQCAHKLSVHDSSRTSVITHSRFLEFSQRSLLPHILTVPSPPPSVAGPRSLSLAPSSPPPSWGLAHNHCLEHFVSGGVGPGHRAVEISKGV